MMTMILVTITRIPSCCWDGRSYCVEKNNHAEIVRKNHISHDAIRTTWS